VDSADGAVTTVLPPGRLDGVNLTWPGRLGGYGDALPDWG
jgi:hypothetical protein